MPLTTRSSTGRRSAEKNNPRLIRKSSSSQRKTTSLFTSNFASSSATSPPLTDSPQTKGKKRKCASHENLPRKRLLNNLQIVPGSCQPLNPENLATLNRHTGSHLSDKMNPTAVMPENSGRRRSASRLSSSTEMNPETMSARSQRLSSITHTQYRWATLDKAQIFIRSRPPPEHVKCYIDAIIKRKTSKDRKHKLAVIAKTLGEEFVTVLEGASSEEDRVEPIHHALSAMDDNEKLALRRKTDWDQCLKPVIPHFGRDFNLPRKLTNNVDDDVVELSSKRRQLDTSINSPDQLEPAMPSSPPPPLPPPLMPLTQNNSIVKTPCPNITVGLRHSTVVETLVVQGINEYEADRFLKDLQEQRRLRSDPAQQATHVRFPLLVIEGKSYSTGRAVFEAQNQATVSGSSMLNIQLQLTELTKSFVPAFNHEKQPLAFSVCTQGRHMELWVHYATYVGGIHNYNMNILCTCYALIPERVTEFLVVVDKILSWAWTEFLNDVTKQLSAVERATRCPTT